MLKLLQSLAMPLLVFIGTARNAPQRPYGGGGAYTFTHAIVWTLLEMERMVEYQMATLPLTGAFKPGDVPQPSSGSQLVELALSFPIADGANNASALCQPDNMVGPAMPDMTFLVQYISIFCWIPQGQTAQVSIAVNGGLWFAMFHQGTIQGYDDYVCSQMTQFTIPPGGGNFTVVRSDTAGVGNLNVHLVGTFVQPAPAPAPALAPAPPVGLKGTVLPQ